MHKCIGPSWSGSALCEPTSCNMYIMGWMGQYNTREPQVEKLGYAHRYTGAADLLLNASLSSGSLREHRPRANISVALAYSRGRWHHIKWTARLSSWPYVLWQTGWLWPRAWPAAAPLCWVTSTVPNRWPEHPPPTCTFSVRLKGKVQPLSEITWCSVGLKLKPAFMSLLVLHGCRLAG